VKSIAAPDRKANEYLVDRVAGRPVAAVEGEINHNAGDSLIAAFGASVAKIYGAPEEPES
jgi:glucose dehydrogenase